MKKYFILMLMLFSLITIDKTYAINLIDVQDFNEIPLPFGTLESANDQSKVGFVNFEDTTGGHYVRITHPNGNIYRIATSGGNAAVVQLPGVDVLEGSLILNSGKYFSEDGMRYLYFEFQNPSASSGSFNGSIFESGNLANGFRPMVIWNLTTGHYDITDKLELFGVVYKGPNRNAYIDVLFPMELDYIVSIQFEWYYRYKGFLGIGGWTDWNYQNEVRLRDQEVPFSSTWHKFKRAFFNPIYTLDFAKVIFEKKWTDAIEDLGSVSPDYMANYLSKVNSKLYADDKPPLTINELFGSQYSVHRVYLAHYSQGLYSDYQIREDIVIIDLQYVYQGELFHPVITDIEWTTVSPYEPPGDIMSNFSQGFHELFGGIWDWIKSWAGPAALIIAIILLFPIIWALIKLIVRIWYFFLPKRKYSKY